jgi:hypothetical protein
MKFSEWKKDFDRRNPGKTFRFMTFKELLSITEWDDQPERLSERAPKGDAIVRSRQRKA